MLCARIAYGLTHGKRLRRVLGEISGAKAFGTNVCWGVRTSTETHLAAGAAAMAAGVDKKLRAPPG